MNNIPVCKLCLEPLSNFLCPDCLYSAIQQWVWRYKPGLIERFSDFHKKFLRTLISERTAFCVACKREYYHMICPYDYIKEVHAWLSDFLPEKTIKEFLMIFSMGFKRMDRHLEHRFFYRNGRPQMQTCERPDTGICESCENFSDNLMRDASDHLVCEKCR